MIDMELKFCNMAYGFEVLAQQLYSNFLILISPLSFLKYTFNT